jgi:hypothetical protein
MKNYEKGGYGWKAVIYFFIFKIWICEAEYVKGVSCISKKMQSIIAEVRGEAELRMKYIPK